MRRGGEGRGCRVVKGRNFTFQRSLSLFVSHESTTIVFQQFKKVLHLTDVLKISLPYQNSAWTP